jgi:hypothetical protein
MIAEYLEHALKFEQLAALEAESKLKADLLNQAAAYRKLATERTSKLGLDTLPKLSNRLAVPRRSSSSGPENPLVRWHLRRLARSAATEKGPPHSSPLPV